MEINITHSITASEQRLAVRSGILLADNSAKGGVPTAEHWTGVHGQRTAQALHIRVSNAHDWHISAAHALKAAQVSVRSS